MSSEDIAKRLKIARENAGLTQRQAAHLADITEQRMRDIEHARHHVWAEELPKFAELYSVSIEWLVGTKTEADLDPQLVAQCEKLPVADRRKLLSLLASL